MFLAEKRKGISGLKKYNKLLFLLICIFVFGIVLNRSYDRFVVRASQATKKIYNENRVNDEREVDISTGEIFRQKFVTDRNGLNSILIKIDKRQILQFDDYIVFQLYDDKTGESIKRWVVWGFGIQQDKYITLNLDKEMVGINGNSYSLYLQKIYAGSEKPEDLKESAESIKNLYCVKNLSNRINYALVGNSSVFIMSYFKAFAILLMGAALFCISIVLFKRKIHIEKVALVYVLLFGLLYMIVFPPFCTPDEYAHFVASYNLSNKMMGIEASDDETIAMDVYNCDGYFTRYASLRHYQYIIDAFHCDTNKAEEQLAKTYSYAGDSGHYVQALGITVARLMNMGYIYIIYIGRLFNFLFCAICIYFAVKIIPIGKECLFMVSMLPMTMEVITSQSYDVFIIGISFLLIAYILNLVYQKEQVSIKNMFIIGILLVLLYPCKYIYTLLGLLVLLIPVRKIKNKNQVLAVIGIVVCILGIALGRKVFIATENIVVEEEEFQTNLKDTISEGENLYSIRDILEKPLETINIFMNTLRDRSGHYIETMFGRYLGSLTIEISSALIIGFYVLVLLSGLKNTKEIAKIPIWHRVMFGLIFLAVAGSALLAMFVSWTPKPGDVIVGVQGRYFLPAFPLAIFILKTDAIELKKDYTKFICVSTCILQFFVLIYSVEQIISVW